MLSSHQMIRILTIFFTLFISLTASLATPKSPIRVGYILPLSGPLADFGIAIKNGVELARRDYPEIKKVFEPIYEDSKYDTRSAITAFQKLKSIDKVYATYIFGGPMTDAIAPLAEQSRLPSYSTEHDAHFSKGKKFLIRYANDAEDFAEVLLKRLDEKGIHTIKIIKNENQYENSMVNGIMNRAQPGQSISIASNTDPSEMDFRSIISLLTLQDLPDAFGIYLLPGSHRSFLTQLKAAGVTATLFGSDSFDSKEENKGLEEYLKGTLYTDITVTKEFSEAYTKTFKNNVRISQAARAYEFSLLLGEKFAKSAPLSPEDFISGLAFSGIRKSVCGDYQFKNSPDTGQNYAFSIDLKSIQ